MRGEGAWGEGWEEGGGGVGVAGTGEPVDIRNVDAHATSAIAVRIDRTAPSLSVWVSLQCGRDAVE